MRFAPLSFTLTLLLISNAHAADLLFGDEFNTRPTSSNYDFGFWWGDSYGPNDADSQFHLDYTQVQANNGVLRLTADKRSERDDWNVMRPYVSGNLSTNGHFSATTFYAEISAKLPHATGAWPAFWTLPANHNDGLAEVDAMEYVGPATGGDITFAWHGGGNDEAEEWDPAWDASKDFHRYGVWVRPGRLDWYVDGVLRHSYSHSSIPANVAQYFMITLQVGGDWPGDATWQQQVMEVDYLRVFNTLAVPEPAAAALLAIGGASLLLRRR